MLHRRYWILFILLTAAAHGQAQRVNAMVRQANKNLKQGHYAEAAALYERAGRLKPSEPSLLYQAGEAYRQVRDYANAANCYKTLQKSRDFPLAGLYYARMMKQQGLYREAREAFQQAWETDNSSHREVVLTVVRNEIKGCDFGLKADSSTEKPALLHLGAPVGSPENEFAPLPFSDTLLYFTGIREGKTHLLRCSRSQGVWKKPAEALGLPPAAAKGFLSGSFSPDGRRFYFARTEAAPLAVRGPSVQAGKCTLYVIRRKDSGEWSEPQRLRAYINLEGSSSLWPFVCEYGDEEWLFFSSNRPGGFGGLDLYVCTRPLASEEFDFSFPLNLGNRINTGSDEITPFYEVFSQTLWFATMGRPTLGGFDVFKAQGAGNRWSAPENPGAPLNSPADDYFYREKKDGSGAFFSSNRRVAGEKDRQSDDDLFELIFPAGQ